MTVKAVVFDVGNVLYGWDPDAFLVRQIADELRTMAQQLEAEADDLAPNPKP